MKRYCLTLFEISNSMKPYPSVFHAYTLKLRPAIGFFEPQNLDEVSNRIPPTSQSAKHGRAWVGTPVERSRPGARGCRLMMMIMMMLINMTNIGVTILGQVQALCAALGRAPQFADVAFRLPLVIMCIIQVKGGFVW